MFLKHGMVESEEIVAAYKFILLQRMIIIIVII